MIQGISHDGLVQFAPVHQSLDCARRRACLAFAHVARAGGHAEVVADG